MVPSLQEPLQTVTNTPHETPPIPSLLHERSGSPLLISLPSYQDQDRRVIAITNHDSREVTVMCGSTTFDTTKDTLVEFAHSVLESPLLNHNVMRVKDV